ncbi:hypothetical protein MMC18_006507 [Xylographa bjoerkii]|nr:hypothetical protein [Xylographa bjoerkii]
MPHTTVDTTRMVLVRKKPRSSSSQALPAPQSTHAPETIAMYGDDAFIWYFIRNYKVVTSAQLMQLWNHYVFKRDGGYEQLPTIVYRGKKSKNDRLFERYRHLQWEAMNVLRQKKEWMGVSEADIAEAARASLDDACNKAPAPEGCGEPFSWTYPDVILRDWSGCKEIEDLEYDKFNGTDSVPDILSGPRYPKRVGWAII